MAHKKRVEYLKYYFTDLERLDMSSEMAQKHHELQQRVRDKKEYTKKFDAEIAALEASISSLVTKIRDGYDIQPVECEVIIDYATKSKIVRRLDTGEIVRSDDLTAEELQMEIVE